MTACREFYSHPVSRRQLLRVCGAGLFGLNMPTLMAAKSNAASGPRSRAKSVIFLFQWGGPSHLDTFDMKPDAPDGIRSPYQDVSTSVPGMRVCELLPKLAQRMDRFSLIRTMTHQMKNHASAGYYAITGRKPPSDDQRLRDSLSLFPAYGSVVDHLAPNSNGVPTFVAYPHVIRDGTIVPGQRASFLTKRHDPFFFGQDPNDASFAIPELSLPDGISFDRIQRRRELQGIIDQQSRMMERSAAIRGFDRYYDKAVSMLTSEKIRRAFDISSEPEKLRETYGRTSYGQSCLLARRLVEAGVKFVSVYFSASIGGRRVNQGGWDTHGFDNTRMYNIVDKYQLPLTDQTLSALVDDLEDRNLLDETLVVWVGEFGRTPRINKNESRDHWPQCYSALLAGGGTKRGFTYGTSDRYGMYPADHPVRPDDLAATMFYLMGISPKTEIHDTANRPLVIADGDPIHELIA